MPEIREWQAIIEHPRSLPVSVNALLRPAQSGLVSEYLCCPYYGTVISS